MVYDTAFPHFRKPLAGQRVLVGVQLDAVGDWSPTDEERE
jgi:hypothetical protein